MLKKIIAIKNLARFEGYCATGNVELKRYTLMFAENGRGKTTLCALLRSLQSNDPAIVHGRATLGGSGAPEVRLLFDSGTTVFGPGGWTVTVPGIAIFDSMFVSENVYAGDSVDVDQRRSLYRVIVGKQGVDLARRIEDLDNASRAKSTDVREKTAAVQANVPLGMTVESFVALPEDAAVAEKIEAAQRELDAVRQADQITTRAALSGVTLPAVPERFAGGIL